jgi:hypothetical protein
VGRVGSNDLEVEDEVSGLKEDGLMVKGEQKVEEEKQSEGSEEEVKLL